jgi:hypothetical protein
MDNYAATVATHQIPLILNITTTTEDDIDENSLTSEHLFVGYSPILLDFAVACCILFILLGIPGNLITIIALLRCKKVRSINYNYITDNIY